MPGKRVLVTSALPYVNNVPHLGNIIGCVLSADVFARYCRSRGFETLYVCGTDEHGTATEVKALEEGITPRELCDKYFAIHKEIYEWFGCSFDVFGRTSTKKHAEITQQIFLKLHENGLITEKELEQTYCASDARFLSDRFVHGVCPHCGYEHARGDQCENCGKLLNPEELKEPRCGVCGNEPETRKSRHLYLDLAKLQPRLEEWTKKRADEGFWTANAKRITESWLKEGLSERAITRDLQWGVPVPLKGFEGKVFYVWFDAPIGYVSITACARKDWGEWWHGSDARLYQFMAKDNVPFHTIVFPATLMGTEEKWNLLYHIDSTEYLNYEGGQFSKSKNVGVFGDHAMESGIPADVWRYYLLANRPEGADTVFDWDDFFEKTNNELIANLGNLVNRVTVFLERFFSGKVPRGKPGAAEEKLWEAVRAVENDCAAHLDKVELRDGLRKAMEVARLGNQYFQEQEPWKSIESDKENAATALFTLANVLKDLAILVEPFLPFTAESIARQLGIEKRAWSDLGKASLGAGHAVGNPEKLFEKLEKEKIAELRKRFSGRRAGKVRDIKLIVDDDAQKLGIKAFGAVVRGVTVKKKVGELKKRCREKGRELEGRDAKNDSVNQGFYDLYERVGVTGFIPATERLYDYIRKGGSIPNINNVVDSYNLVAVETMLTIGAHDAEKIKGDVHIKVTDGSEKYTPLGKRMREPIAAGEYAFVDDEKVICRLDVKQCDQTKVGPQTTSVFVYVQGNERVSDDAVKDALKRVCENMVRYCGGAYRLTG